MTESLDAWLEREYRYAVTALQKSISRTDLVKARPGFGQTVRAAKGSIVASPVLGAYDPDPDYFFHWFRDSAVVIDALRIAYEDGAAGAEALTHLADFVRFSRGLEALDGHKLADSAGWRAKVAADFEKYLREPSELAAVNASNVVAEARVNPDGTLDISKWARPQHDGPPLRALALMRWMHLVPADLKAELAPLLQSDLAFTLQRWQQRSFDIWEEEIGAHYYTLRVSAAALQQGASWLGDQGDAESAAAQIFHQLDELWSEQDGYIRSRRLPGGARAPKELDVSVILAAIHSCASGFSPTSEPHSPGDPRLLRTLDKLCAHFAQAYAINRDLPAGAAPALGRYPGDVYYDGSAWYIATFGAAELCYRAGQRDRGDAFLATARLFTPASGELSEQFDRNTGAQVSAKHLTWSYAALISCAHARRRMD